MIRLTVVLVLALALLTPSAAFAQAGGQSPFGPLPPAQPTPAPPPPEQEDDPFGEDVGRTTLYVIAGGLLIAFVGIGVFISRDARKALPRSGRRDYARLREQGPHKHQRQAKARARARGKAQKAARRRNR
jgi:hypothetical protein